MKPAICVLCGKCCTEEKPPCRGDWVLFSEYEQPDSTSLDDPDGLVYFCDEHIAAARALASSTSKEAMTELQRQYGVAFTNKNRLVQSVREPWWRRIFFKRKGTD